MRTIPKHEQPRDPEAINLLEDAEVKYWTKLLGCSVMELKAAVEAVGHSTTRVRSYLEEQKQT